MRRPVDRLDVDLEGVARSGVSVDGYAKPDRRAHLPVYPLRVGREISARVPGPVVLLLEHERPERGLSGGHDVWESFVPGERRRDCAGLGWCRSGPRHGWLEPLALLADHRR